MSKKEKEKNVSDHVHAWLFGREKNAALPLDLQCRQQFREFMGDRGPAPLFAVRR